MSTGNRDSDLLKNVILFGISSFGTKLMYFFLVPLYTSYLTTQDYGTVDMLNTIISLLIPTITLGMIESLLRFIIVDKEKKEAILDCSLTVLTVAVLILCAVVAIIWMFDFFALDPIFYLFLIFNFLFNSLYQILCNYYRGMNLVKYMMIAGIVNAFVTCSCNIIFLAVLKWGVNGYLAATLIGVCISTLFLVIHMLVKRYYRPGLRKVDKSLFKDMIGYGRPMILNGLSWWINNSLDRIIIVSIMNASANGVYAVAYKIPSILSVFQTIFNQAWMVSAIQEVNSEDKDAFYSKMYRGYESAMFLICGLLILANMPLAKILYAKDFFTAWHYTIPLIIAALAGAMSIFISSVFCAVGNTKVIGYTTLLGAAVNIVLNLILIPITGLLGAAVATVISNVIIWITRMGYTKKYVNLKVHPMREVVCFFLIVVQAVAAYQESHYYGMQILVLFLLMVLFRKEIKLYVKMMEVMIGKLKKRIEM